MGPTIRDRETMHLLVVEDDESIAEPLTEGLEREGFEVTRVSTGAEALAAEPADLILLDLGLPDIDGREVCRRIRDTSETPIIVVTARAEEVDRVLLLEIGADDYVVKPFGFRELVARIRAVGRHAGGSPEEQTRHQSGPLTLDVRTHVALMNGEELELTPKEFDLLALLISQPGTVFTREEILDRVWDTHWYGPTKTLDVHVAALRKKLGGADWITTVRGVGFKLTTPDGDPGAEG